MADDPEQQSPAYQSPPAYQPPPPSITADALCTLARTDLRHDFHKVIPAAQLEAAGNYSIPGTAECRTLTEEGALAHFLGITVNPVDRTFELPPTGYFHDDYHCIPKLSYEELYAKGFKEAVTSSSNIFLVVDTFTEGFRDALSALRTETTPGPTLYWLQNRQTLYDPATKISPLTDAGKEIMRNNPRVRFCWEDTSAPAFSTIERYPPWSLPLNRASTATPVLINSLQNKNAMFYSKNDIYMVLRTDAENNYRSQESVCVMKTDNPVGNQRSTVIIDKAMASRAGVGFAYGTYSALAKSLYALLGQVGAQNATTRTSNEVETMLTQHHVAAKRLGDQGQALSCLKVGQTLNYEEVIFQGGAPGNRKRPIKNEPNNASQLSQLSQPSQQPRTRTIVVPRKRYQPRKGKEVTNGINCFVTIDRVALCSALLYRAPVALFQYRYDPAKPLKENYVALFVRKTLLDPATQKRLAIDGLFSRIDILKRETAEAYANYGALTEELRRIIHASTLPYLYQAYRTNLARLLENTSTVIEGLHQTTLSSRDESKKREAIFQDWVASLYVFVPTFTDITTRFTHAKERIKDQVDLLEQYTTNVKFLIYPAIVAQHAVVEQARARKATLTEKGVTALAQQVHAELVNLENEMAKIRELETTLRNFKEIYEELNSRAVGKQLLCGGDLQNIQRSSFFLPHSYSQRHFIPKASSYTLSSYLCKIKDMIQSVYEGEPQRAVYLGNFLSVITTCMNVMRHVELRKRVSNMSKANQIASYLYDVMPELAEVENVNITGGKRRTRATRKRNKNRNRRGGAVLSGPVPREGAEQLIQRLKWSYIVETVIRTVGAILYAAYKYNMENEAMRRDPTQTNDIYHDIIVSATIQGQITPIANGKDIIVTLLTKLDQDEEPVPQDVITQAQAQAQAPNTETYYYYLPFIQEQITQVGTHSPTLMDGLQTMYDSLLQERNVVIPADITDLVMAFMKEGETYDTFFKIPGQEQDLYESPRSGFVPYEVQYKTNGRSTVKRTRILGPNGAVNRRAPMATGFFPTNITRETSLRQGLAVGYGGATSAKARRKQHRLNTWRTRRAGR